ncbi:MAG: glutamate racemase [Thiotrichales bacterium]|nr:glutamate racemase [Thiotrichales bacterium]
MGEDVLDRPIGIFDSGIGGLPIAAQVHQLLPKENLLYLADTAYAPYGERSEAEILARSIAVVEFLLAQQVKAIVVACNTATMISIKTLRERYQLPFIGVEPGVKPAAIHTKSGVIGVLATPKTLSSQAFFQLAKRVAGHVQVEMQPCPKLVRLVESLQLATPEVFAAVEEYVQPLLEKGADTLILGCTHFAHLAPVIQQVAGNQVQVISTELAVAKEVQRRLQPLETQGKELGQVHFVSNGDPEQFRAQVNCLWPELPVRIFSLSF